MGLHLPASTTPPSTLINGLGGLKAIAISHPHFYTTMAEWSRAFGGVPVHLHADDQRWIMRPDPCIKLWRGETLALLPDVTLIRGGGHFPGGSMLHWAKGAEGRGVVCAADIATVNMDRKSFTFMRSYPNFIPLSAKGAQAIRAALTPYRFDRSPATTSTASSRAMLSRSLKPPSSAMSLPLTAPTTKDKCRSTDDQIECSKFIRVRHSRMSVCGPLRHRPRCSDTSAVGAQADMARTS